MWGSKSAAVDYIGLIAYLIKSNQEIYEDLQTTKEDLQTTKAELQSEKNKVATMELLVASLVKRVGDLENNVEAVWGTLHLRLAELEKCIN
jgi:peptidoglycan hydrolase CwlO-like protein